MAKIIQKLANKPVKSIMIIKLIADILCVIICYDLFPYLLNYPPGSINTEFQLLVNPTYYYVYYFVIFGIGIFIDLIITYRMLKSIKKINHANIKNEELLKIRKVCFEFSNKSFITTTYLIPLVVIFVALLITNTNFVLTIKIGMLGVMFLGIPNLIIYFLSSSILKQVLIKTFNEDIFKTEKTKKTKIWKKSLIQIFSTVAISLIIIFLFIMANITNELGNYRYETYKEKLISLSNDIERNKVSLTELNNYLHNNLEEKWFTRINGVYSGETEISNFIKNYIDFYSRNNGGRIYDDFGVDKQGVVNYIQIDGQEVLIGLIYNTIPNYLFISLLSLMIMFLMVNALIIYLSSNAIGKDLIYINDKLENMIKNKKIETNLLPVTTTDEIGELTKEFNNVQESTNKLYEEILKNQEIIALQSKFSAVGELAAGMAHDINNPACSLETSIGLLKNFKVEEQKEEQYKRLIDNMSKANEKILTIVNNTTEQFRNHSKNSKEEFSLQRLINKLIRAEESEISKIDGKINLIMYKDIILYGIESKLYQVILNIVRNAILSYKENNRKGDINILATEDYQDYVISIEDKAGGIPEEIRDNLFKKILTTRGTKGTGLRVILI